MGRILDYIFYLLYFGFFTFLYNHLTLSYRYLNTISRFSLNSLFKSDIVIIYKWFCSSCIHDLSKPQANITVMLWILIINQMVASGTVFEIRPTCNFFSTFKYPLDQSYIPGVWFRVLFVIVFISLFSFFFILTI